MATLTKLSSKFTLGQMVMTPGIREHVSSAELLAALVRHAAGDWGDLPDEDRAANESALRYGGRLMSAYLTRAGERFWIITEADRSKTTALLPDEY